MSHKIICTQEHSTTEQSGDKCTVNLDYGLLIYLTTGIMVIHHSFKLSPPFVIHVQIL